MSNSLAAAEAEARTLQAEIETLQAEHADAKKAAREFGAGATSEDDLTEVDAKWLVADQINDEAARKGLQLAAAQTELIASMRSEMARTVSSRTSFGARYTGSTEYQGKLAQLAGRKFSQEDRLPRVEVATAEETARYLASTDGSAMVPTDERLTPIELPSRTVRLLDLITVTSTGSDAVDIVKETLVDDNAVPTAHASAGATGVAATGVASPLSEYRLTKVTLPVRRIPHHTIQPRSMLADAPRLGSLIDNRLRRGVRLQTEAQVLAGGGTGENFNGIITQAGSDQAHSNATDVVADSIHMAMTLVRIAYEDDVTGVVMHPTDYQDFVLATDSNGAYLSGNGQFGSTPPTAWGYPVVVTTLITPGTILAGAFAEAVLYVRSGIEVMSGFMDQQMIEDLVTVNAEYRAAFGVDRAQAFATVTRGA